MVQDRTHAQLSLPIAFEDAPRRGRPYHLILALAILGLAAGLRLHNLTWNSFDNDEAFSWVIAGKPLVQLVSDSLHLRGDPHPPVYWVTLKGWMALAGESEFALRLLSVFAGVLFVALVFELGYRLFSALAGAAAALYAALSPFLIWHSQDARMYTFGAALALAGLVCLVNGLQRRSNLWWAGYFIFTSLACYSHIAASFLLPFEALLIVSGAPRFRRTWWKALLALTAVGAALLPYALNAWRFSGGGGLNIFYTPPFADLLRTVTLMLASYRGPLSIPQQWSVVGIVGFVFILGVLAGRRERGVGPSFGQLLVVLFYLVPLLAISVLSLRQSVFQPKSVTFIAAAMALGVGAGWARLWRWRRWTGALVGLALLGVELYGVGVTWRPGFQKEDWRRAAAYVAGHLGQNDVVLIHLEYYRVVFTYYFDELAPVIAPFGSHLAGPAEVDATLQQFTDYDTIWLLQSGEFLTDPDHLVQSWLSERYPLGTELFPHSISIHQYLAHPETASLPPSAAPAEVIFGGTVRLLGFETDAERLSAKDEWVHPPSNWIHLRLYWSLLGPLAGEPAVQITVEDEVGKVWGGNMPRAGELRARFPMTAWTPGAIMRDELDLNLNPDMPPGQYKIVARLLSPTGERLPVEGAGSGPDWVILQRVEIIP